MCPRTSSRRRATAGIAPIVPTGSRGGDFAQASAVAGLAETPVGYTWHHNEAFGVMQLVDSAVHAAAGHTGGFAIVGGITRLRNHGDVVARTCDAARAVALQPRKESRVYDFRAFVEEERGGDHFFGRLLAWVSLEEPSKTLSFDTALVEFQPSSGSVRVSHDLYLDRAFEMSRDDFRRAIKDAIASSREFGPDAEARDEGDVE